MVVSGGALAAGSLQIAYNMIMNGYWGEFARISESHVSFLPRYDDAMDHAVILGSISAFFMIDILPKCKRIMQQNVFAKF